MRTKEYFETALDAGKVKILMASGKLWQCRRNGKTQLWKTRPNDFRIPIKYGFKSYGAVDQGNINSPEIVILDS